MYKKILIVVAIVFALLQVYQPAQNNAELREVVAFEAETLPNKIVKAVFENNCYNCHSNKTEYPWYAAISPISLLIDHHVAEGNEHFNVSIWEEYSDKKKGHKLDELIEEVGEGEMPEWSYTLVHGTITEIEKEAVLDWAQKAREKYVVSEINK